MQILEGCREGCAIALGNFDGLHSAHIEIINACKSYAAEKNIKCGVLLFDRHTSEFFGEKVGLLTTMSEKLAILEGAGVDFVYVMHFDMDTASLLPEEFLRGILAEFNAEAFFAGYDYTFGKGAAGTAQTLAELGKKLGFEAVITPRIDQDGKRVSSSLIRSLLSEGDIEGAARFLGRAYSVEGEVIRGFGNGKKALFPTANIGVEEIKFLPPDGVYAGAATVKGKRYRTAVNIGKNPTLDAKVRTVEAFILDFDGELYGEHIKVEFIKKLRSEKKFESLAGLKEQIARDISAARETEI